MEAAYEVKLNAYKHKMSTLIDDIPEDDNTVLLALSNHPARRLSRVRASRNDKEKAKNLLNMHADGIWGKIRSVLCMAGEETVEYATDERIKGWAKKATDFLIDLIPGIAGIARIVLKLLRGLIEDLVEWVIKWFKGLAEDTVATHCAGVSDEEYLLMPNFVSTA